MKSLISILSLGLLALLNSSVGMALTVTATSSNYNPLVGQQFTVTLHATDVVNVGGITLDYAWDTTKATFANPLSGTNCQSCLPATGPVGAASGAQFFVSSSPNMDVINIVLPGAVNGDFDFAVLTFNAIATGNPNIVFSDDGGNATGWFDNDTADPIPDTNYINAQINIVPIPPAIWLLGTALAGLGGRGWLRRKATT